MLRTITNNDRGRRELFPITTGFLTADTGLLVDGSPYNFFDPSGDIYVVELPTGTKEGWSVYVKNFGLDTGQLYVSGDQGQIALLGSQDSSSFISINGVFEIL